MSCPIFNAALCWMVCTNNCTVYRVYSRHCRYYVKITRFFNDHVISSAYIECRTWTFLYMVAQYTQQFEPRRFTCVFRFCVCVGCFCSRWYVIWWITSLIEIISSWNYALFTDKLLLYACCVSGTICKHKTFALPLLFSVRLSLRELVYAAPMFFS